MREAALAVTTTVACAVVAWRSNAFNWRLPFSSSRPRKRVSFSEADNTIIQFSLDELTDEERKALCWTPAELREFARSTRIDHWIEEWGS